MEKLLKMRTRCERRRKASLPFTLTDVAELPLRQGPQEASLGSAWSAGGRLGPVDTTLELSANYNHTSNPHHEGEMRSRSLHLLWILAT